MILGKTGEKKLMRHQARIAKLEALKQWHWWFAWHFVEIRNTKVSGSIAYDTVWLEWVYRKASHLSWNILGGRPRIVNVDWDHARVQKAVA